LGGAPFGVRFFKGFRVNFIATIGQNERRANAVERKRAEIMQGPKPEDGLLDESRPNQRIDLDRLFTDL